MVCAHMQDEGHCGVRATTHRLGAYCAWDNMEKDIAKFIRQCLHCIDSKAGNAMPRPLGDLVHGMEVDDVFHCDYLSLGESDAIDTGGLVDGGYKHVLVLMDDVSHLAGRSRIMFDGGSGAFRAEVVCLVWGAQGVHQ